MRIVVNAGLIILSAAALGFIGCARNDTETFGSGRWT